MISRRNKIRIWVLYLGDLLAIGMAFLCAYWFRGSLPQDPEHILFPFALYTKLLWVVFCTWSILFYLKGLYHAWQGEGFWKETWAIIQAIFISCLLLGFTVFALKYQFVSRIFIISFALFNLLLTCFFRFLSRKVILFLNHRNESSRFILILGLEEEAVKIAERIEKHKDLGLRVLGFLSTQDSSRPSRINGYPVLGEAQELPLLLEREVVDEVIFAVSQEELRKMENLLLVCEERGITSRVILNFFPHVISRTHLEELDGFPLLTFSTTPKNELLLFLRRTFDFMGSLFLIGLASPVFLLITLFIRLDSPGCALYRQARCGLNGRKFTLYKFRSMHEGAEERRNELVRFNMMKGPVFKMKNDPRVTRVGRFLRKTSLDELPQLFNVLRGNMSLVGPRPLPIEEIEKLKGWERRRLSMKPGITGLWQVSGRNHIDFHDWIKLDLEYIDNWSLWLDFKILLKTIPAVLSGKGAM